MSTISQWAVYQMCQTFDNNYSYILKIVKDVYPELYSQRPTHHWERKSILDYFHKSFTELLITNDKTEEEKQKPFQWYNWKETTDKETTFNDLTLHPSANSLVKYPTNFDIYNLCKKKNHIFKNVVRVLTMGYPEIYIPADVKQDQLQSRVRMIYKRIRHFLRSDQLNELDKEKKTLFTWCHENPICKQTTQSVAELDSNETKDSLKDDIVNAAECESPTNCVSVDNHFSTSPPSPPASLYRSPTILPVSQVQTTPPTGTPPPPLLLSTEASRTSLEAASTSLPPSPIETLPGVSDDPESQNLILAIKTFENLIGDAMQEIAEKDAKIENLKKQITNARNNHSKFSCNLKRLQYQHLRKKIIREN